jgi:pimeloyl-ACP methyl ester carboxylesterase
LTIDTPLKVDYLEAGTCGPLVVLVHSAISGARMWLCLMEDLKDQFRVRAVNLFGYGKTPPWPNGKAQSLDDQAALVEAVLPADADEIHLVGHSMGGVVAMKAAARLGCRVTKLVLLEPNAVNLLAQPAHAAVFAEVSEQRDCIKRFGALGEWATVAETFAEYWGGPGSWRDMSPEHREAFTKALKPNFFEWDALINETTSATQWAELLPPATLLLCDPQTVRPIRAIATILRNACPRWTYKEVLGGGHMAPLTRPELVNPVVSSFLSDRSTR